MFFRAISLPVACRTWTRTKICWLLANTFYILPDWFLPFPFFFFFKSRFEALILVHVIFQLGKQIKQTTTTTKKTTKQDKKLPRIANLYDILLIPSFFLVASHLSSSFHSKIHWKNCLYQPLTYTHFLLFLRPISMKLYPFHSTISAVAKFNGHIFILILLSFLAEI